MIQDWKEKLKLKIKGDGQLEYHIGGDYKLDKDGTLVNPQNTSTIYDMVFWHMLCQYPDSD